MNAGHILDALEMIDDQYIIEAREHSSRNTTLVKNTGKKALKLKHTLALAAVIAALLALCGFTAYKLGWVDLWLQKPSADPIQTVQSAIENQADKAYTISVHVDEIKVDDGETTRIRAMYSGSELAEQRGWTDEYLAEHFVVVWAKYYVAYDHTKTFMDDGYTEQYFYLTQDLRSGDWTIIDNTSPNTSAVLPEEMNILIPHAVWQYQPLLSAKLPAYPFDFNLPYSSIEAECDNGLLVDYDNHSTTAYPQGKQLSLSSGSTLYWTPQTEESDSIALSAKINFTIYDGDNTTYTGSLSISGDSVGGNTTDVSYSAVLNKGSGLSMEQAVDTAGAVITTPRQALAR